MAGIQIPPDESDVSLQQQLLTRVTGAGNLVSDDERSVAADSWSIKSDYGSILDDEQRHADAAEALSFGNFHTASDYRFGVDVMDVVTSLTKSLCIEISQVQMPNLVDDTTSELVEQGDKCLSEWSVLDIGTGNGILLQELAKLGFCDLTGIDYSEAAIDLAQSLAVHDGFSNIKFLVDDVLETKMERQFQVVVDKGTLDVIGLHPDGPIKRVIYWDSVSKLLAPGGIFVITSCKSTEDELVQEVETYSQRKIKATRHPENPKDQEGCRDPPFKYYSHVRTHRTFMFDGVVESRVATVAFLRN
ncbi:protein-lysine N-methyltransferase EFM4-like isoform X2 [Tripterygium wilfordii]|uniref:protein-lysine N-methyltransferase EFM4-like isoform X2 n=1 Tax=Tripterygium wilfordii TaxID=458696 RepID=UPI0018F83F05|nr:protein-lysine N-methyltransferase EFM4-like isoform X2 [Tripterygium wilfordii]